MPSKNTTTAIIVVAVVGGLAAVGYFAYKGLSALGQGLGQIQLPSFSTGNLPLSTISLPNISLPNISLPNISLPSFSPQPSGPSTQSIASSLTSFGGPAGFPNNTGYPSGYLVPASSGNIPIPSNYGVNPNVYVPNSTRTFPR